MQKLKKTCRKCAQPEPRDCSFGVFFIWKKNLETWQQQLVKATCPDALTASLSWDEGETKSEKMFQRQHLWFYEWNEAQCSSESHYKKRRTPGSDDAEAVPRMRVAAAQQCRRKMEPTPLKSCGKVVFEKKGVVLSQLAVSYYLSRETISLPGMRHEITHDPALPSPQLGSSAPSPIYRII